MASDRDFLRRFQDASLPRAEWSHEAHLRVAYLLLRGHGLPEAARCLRRGIRGLDRAHGLEDAQEGAYHETLTLAWARLVEDALERTGPVADFDAFIGRNPELLARGRVLLHYSRERLGSARARREFVLPDRAPLPAGSSPGSVRNRSGRRKDFAREDAEAVPRSLAPERSRRT